MVVDASLRRLDEVLYDRGVSRAFADDASSAVAGLFLSLPPLARISEEWAVISGLRLNCAKTVTIPLRVPAEASYDEVTTLFVAIGGDRVQVLVRTFGKYLNFHIGPGRSDAVRDKATIKRKCRAGDRSGMDIG